VTAAAQYAHNIESSEVMGAARRCAQTCLPAIMQGALVGLSAHVATMLMSAYRKGGMPLFRFADRSVGCSCDRSLKGACTPT
jgi:hypothetical protein